MQQRCTNAFPGGSLPENFFSAYSMDKGNLVASRWYAPVEGFGRWPLWTTPASKLTISLCVCARATEVATAQGDSQIKKRMTDMASVSLAAVANSLIEACLNCPTLKHTSSVGEGDRTQPPPHKKRRAYRIRVDDEDFAREEQQRLYEKEANDLDALEEVEERVADLKQKLVQISTANANLELLVRRALSATTVTSTELRADLELREALSMRVLALVQELEEQDAIGMC